MAYIGADILAEIPATPTSSATEPAIGPGDEINLEGIEWMIVGGSRDRATARWTWLGLAICSNAVRRKADCLLLQAGLWCADREMRIDALGAIYRDYRSPGTAGLYSPCGLCQRWHRPREYG